MSNFDHSSETAFVAGVRLEGSVMELPSFCVHDHRSAVRTELINNRCGGSLKDALPLGDTWRSE